LEIVLEYEILLALNTGFHKLNILSMKALTQYRPICQIQTVSKLATKLNNSSKQQIVIVITKTKFNTNNSDKFFI